jgi:peptidyl-tRNA hydrolase, PTH1 family
VKLVAGLGNPGARYRGTRHNVGFAALDRLAQRLCVAVDREKFHALAAECQRGQEKILLLKPLTFMNLSGDSVARAARNRLDAPEDLLVIYDDVDLPLGKIRLRPHGSAGGHNGMKSIIERLGTQDFPRLRIGIGKDPGAAELTGHVLGKFRPDERPVVDDAIDRAAEAVMVWLDEGITTAMNRFNQT